MLELLEQLIAIPSFSREETAAADCIESWMKAHGLQPQRLGNNLWLCGPRDESKPTIMLNAHIDTVKPVSSWTRDPFSPTRDGDALYGLGSNDDGGSLIALLAAYLRLVDTQQPYNLMFSASAEEEVCGAGGVEAILPQLGPVDLWIIGEPTGMQMAVAEKGLMVLDCKVRGESGHAARNEGVNAIYEALPVIDWFRNYQFPRVSEFLGPVKMTVTQINAGTQHNVIPAECSFVVDIRPNGLYSNVELLGLIKGMAGCEVKERSTRLNSSSISMEHPVVRRGLELGLTAFGSPTASNQTVLPYTTIKIGPGQSSRSHTADEYILVSEIEQGIETYVKLLDGLEI